MFALPLRQIVGTTKNSRHKIESKMFPNNEIKWMSIFPSIIHNSPPRKWQLVKGQKRSQHYNPGDIDRLRGKKYKEKHFQFHCTWISFQVTIQVGSLWNWYLLLLTFPASIWNVTRSCALVAWICLYASIFFSLATQTYPQGSSTRNIAFVVVLHNVGGSNTPWIGL